jgi:catechol 2,3-dioxygenase-like lactoylglutathione lyase family enzyme
MKIYQVNANCFHTEEMREFYQEVLEMDLIVSGDSSFTVMAGSTKLVFQKDETRPYYHLCFRLGADYYEHIYRKLAERNLLLPNSEGEYRLFWEGKQAYFTDPDGNILELLERPFIWGNEHPGNKWYDIGEVGMPVVDVAGMQEKLAPYIDDQHHERSGTFAFYGDNQGVLVVVKDGRHWYPTERGAEIHPLRIVVSGKKESRYFSEEYPYEIIVRKEWDDSLPAVQFRMARPTNRLEKLVEFYREGVGLKQIGEFRNHEGYDGIMLGLPGHVYHLEFTQEEEPVELPTPTKEHLLVFYIPNRFKLERIIRRLKKMGYPEVEPENPYWGREGVTIEDPDGWRIVLMNTAGI